MPPPSALSSGAARPSNISTDRPNLVSNQRNGHRSSSYSKQSTGFQYHPAHCYPGEMPSIPVTPSAASGYPTPPFQESFLIPLNDNFLGHQPFDLFSSLTSQPFLPNDPRTPTSGSSHSAGFDGSELDAFGAQDAPPAFSDWYQDNGITPGFNMPHSHIHGPWHPHSNERHPAELNRTHFHPSGSIESPSSFSLFNALGIPGNDPSLSPAHSIGFVEANSTYLPPTTMPFELSSSGTHDTFNHSPGASDLSDLTTDSWGDSYHHRNVSEPSQDPNVGFFDLQSLAGLAAATNLKAAPRTLYSDLELLKLVQSYPAMMLQKNFYPPFVHHSLYRDTEGRVAGPLANALCCVSAYSNIVPSSESLVYNMINTERERLIRRSHSWTSPDINALGALHAMCVYQIIGLLDIKDPAQIRNAELQHPYFLKLARRLWQENRYVSGRQNEYMDWETWVVDETLRRTFYLVNIVNTLSRRFNPQNLSYYEGLDEDLILNSTLPAPDQMWKATTSEEWEAAKRKFNWDPRNQPTVHMIISRLGDGHLDEENRAWFADLQPLSLLIIACVRLCL